MADEKHIPVVKIEFAGGYSPQECYPILMNLKWQFHDFPDSGHRQKKWIRFYAGWWMNRLQIR
jgi:hypothetical protein